ncbi:adenylyltransferase/cytidyltransferase family protein [Olsenella uli]|uniref:bifunctional riboflavin kinase/FMN adenylyltransferase n=1 Tax=Olsenella uli TaxID=133926 RepID=UPI00195CCA64|nr:riboflavin kinase [Olsenella uli]MBM6676644.1 adenylyltransferase/cytidyltransferase family protein [Olsenella uli]
MGEKNLEQQLLALSPDNPIGGVGGVPPKSALRGTFLRNTSDALVGVARRVGLHGFKKSVCVIGAFDGVHVGHRALVARAREEALARGDELVVVTFSPDPSVVLCPEHPQKLLLSDEARLRALRSVEGVDRVVVLDFTPELAALPYERFVRETLGELMDLDVIVVGSDFRLGAGGAGTVEALAELGRADGFGVVGMALLDEGGAPVTATRIRGLLGAGRVEAAAGLLGRCHVVPGEVEHGRGEGTGFGFPTANVRVPAELCLPAEGVYAGYVICDDTAWPAAINVGKPRSFSPGEEGAPFLEATLLGFEGDLYGARVEVAFARWLREPRSFSSVGELERVVLGNVSWVRATLGERGISLRGEAFA